MVTLQIRETSVTRLLVFICLHWLRLLQDEWWHHLRFIIKLICGACTLHVVTRLQPDTCVHFCHKVSRLLGNNDHATISLAERLRRMLARLLLKGPMCFRFCSSYCDMLAQDMAASWIFAQVFIVLDALCGPGAYASGRLVVFIVNIYIIYILCIHICLSSICTWAGPCMLFLCLYTCVVWRRPTL